MSNKTPIALPIESNSLDSNVITVGIPQTNVISITNILKCEIYNRSRVVKFLSIIDIFFLIINFIISIMSQSLSYLFLILLPLCYFGYKGAKEYKSNFIWGYVCYLFLMTIQYIILSFYYSNFILFIMLFIEAYFLFYTIKLIRLLNKLSDNEKQSLKDGWTPENIVIHFI